MANQYEVLGKAPDIKDLQKLSGSNLHLQIKNLNAGYGKMEILHNFDLFVSKAQSLCLIGPNGAGKSTILHSIYGFTNIFSGQIEIDGKEITNLTPAEKLKTVGIAYILQDNSVFPDMTVEENLLMGGFIKEKTEALSTTMMKLGEAAYTGDSDDKDGEATTEKNLNENSDEVVDADFEEIDDSDKDNEEDMKKAN